ncbi:V4R domain-containing protein [Ruminiclostridium cellobioparum]|uniref:Putative hydrocarbon binding protein (Contains V4R domain) n=1 Tax=Ruminiclostridium cellobioparum subsp. termitidis CT1112 TaxID=1195236 RepID=S0FXT5_RUMCE|nr:V4R domain-containing protein [Ruminiclostridium cellobioparum]EMS73924.1 putative hydrocarbon binding protein (contains V4R domain) [Ruminiclostridium cellobioparum subsp. termitidis CT1112]
MSDTFRCFEWESVGDVGLGRPTLGEKMHVAAYRMFHYAHRCVLEKNYGKEAVKRNMVEAGRAVGEEFCQHMLDINLPPADFFRLLNQKMAELGIGILEVEHADFENMIFILTVSEDLDCSGVPATGEAICNYAEGFITGIMQRYTDRQFIVKEINCWSTGDWTCRFHVVAI